MKKFIKSLFIGTGVHERVIKYSLAKGIKMEIDLGHKSQRLLGLDEREVQQSFKKFATACSSFVDIGASDGYYGLIYHKLNKSGKAYLCDANPAFAAVQEKNFKLNQFSVANISFISKFICNYEDADHVSLDKLIPAGDSNIFLKIDVDGGELEVLKGVENTLRNKNCRVIVETHSKDLEDSCTQFLQNLGYRTEIIPNAWYRAIVPETRPITHNRWFSAQK